MNVTQEAQLIIGPAIIKISSDAEEVIRLINASISTYFYTNISLVAY